MGTGQGISAVLVAAGQSQRMGTTNKLALTIDGEPLLRRCARRLLASKVQEVVVVLGHAADWAAHVLADLSVRVVVNTEYTRGQIGSVNLGLAVVAEPSAGVMISLADMPLLTTEDYDALVEAYQSPGCKEIMVPFHGGQRGNPVIISDAVKAKVLQGGVALGCRRFIDANPDQVTRFDVPSDHYTTDIDTPEDYANLIARKQPRLD